jgi:hypothetical protein
LKGIFFPFTALSRIPTNTLRGIKEHTNKLSPFIDLLPPGSTLVADPEFDVEANYWLGWGRKIDLQIKPKQIGPRKPGRKRAFRSFDKRKYSQRKLGERPFGNLERRIPRSYYRTPESKLKGAILLGCHHNLRAYFHNRMRAKLYQKLS